MKNMNIKKFIVLILIIVIILITLFGIMSFTYINKKVYDTNSYIKMMNNLNCTVTDLSNDYLDNSSIKTYLQSKNKDNTYQIDFYIMKNENSAKSYYKELKNHLIKESSGIDGNTTTNKINYYKFNIEANGAYGVVIRSKNTIVYVNTNIKNKDKIVQIVKYLGY